MIQISEHADGSILPVWAKPGARKTGLGDEHAGALRVSVTAAPEAGRANEAIVDALAEGLGLRRSQVTLLSGASNRAKRFLIRGIQPEELREKIEMIPTKP